MKDDDVEMTTIKTAEKAIKRNNKHKQNEKNNKDNAHRHTQAITNLSSKMK